jgi:hypothetical protein
MDLSVVTVFPSLSAVGTWEEVLLLSMEFTVSPPKNGISAAGCKFLFEKALAFLTACVYCFLTSLKVAYRGDYSKLVQYATGCFCAVQGQSS